MARRAGAFEDADAALLAAFIFFFWFGVLLLLVRALGRAHAAAALSRAMRERERRAVRAEEVVQPADTPARVSPPTLRARASLPAPRRSSLLAPWRRRSSSDDLPGVAELAVLHGALAPQHSHAPVVRAPQRGKLARGEVDGRRGLAAEGDRDARA